MRLLKEMAKRMIELCDGSLQGMASTLNLLTYYNDIFGGALKHELEILNGMMARKLCKAKNEKNGLDLECRFDGKSNGQVHQPERVNQCTCPINIHGQEFQLREADGDF